jgi:hypothetical protein
MPVLIAVFSSVDDFVAADSDPALQPLVVIIASASTPAKNDMCLIKPPFSEDNMIPEFHSGPAARNAKWLLNAAGKPSPAIHLALLWWMRRADG